MSLPKAEKLFVELATTEDADLVRMIGEWEPFYRHRKREEGNRLIAQFKERGIDACLSAELSHDRVVSMAIDAAEKSDMAAAASAFVYATNPTDENRKRWLNPLRAVSLILRLPRHRFQSDDDEESRYDQCGVCGEYRKATWMPMNAANDLPSGYTSEDFQVFKTLMIARWSNQTAPPTVTRKDEMAFRRFLKVIADAPAKATALQVSRELAKKLKGYVEWSFHLEALAFAGILKTDKQPGNLQQWTNFNERKKTGHEVPTPMCHWRRRMGFDPDVFELLFPSIKLPAHLRAKTMA